LPTENKPYKTGHSTNRHMKEGSDNTQIITNINNTQQLAPKGLHICSKSMIQQNTFAFCVVVCQKLKILQRSKHTIHQHVTKVVRTGLQNNVSGTCQFHKINYIF